MSPFLLLTCLVYFPAAMGEGGLDTSQLSSSDPGTHPSRDRRSTPTRCPVKFNPHHSACLVPSPRASHTGVTDADITLILDAHNLVRANTRQNATGMLYMSWDEELAQVAQSLASSCSLAHDQPPNRDIPGRFEVGQNIAMGLGNWSVVVDSWEAQETDFVFERSNTLDKVGNYVQLVTADTSLVGCGFAVCQSQSFYVCNYGPVTRPLNLSHPYQQGNPCSYGTQKCPSCRYGKLCACSHVPACENGGTLDAHSCSCQCASPLHRQPLCRLPESNSRSRGAQSRDYLGPLFTTLTSILAWALFNL